MEDEVKTDLTTNQEVTPVTPEVETPNENQTEGSNAEAIELINRYAEGSDTSTPQAIIDALVVSMNKLVPFQDKIRDVAENDTASAAFLHDFMETGNVLRSFVRNYDPEEVEAAVEDMRENDDYEGDRKMHSERLASSASQKEQHAKNVNQSQLDCQAFLDKNEITDEELPEFEKFYAELMDDARDDKMSVKHWDSVWQAYKYKDDVAEAESNGQVMGRNEKIMTKKASKEDLAKLLPEEGGGAMSKKEVVKPMPYSYKSPLKKLNI